MSANWSRETRMAVRAALSVPGATSSDVARQFNLRRESVRLEKHRMAVEVPNEPIVVPPRAANVRLRIKEWKQADAPRPATNFPRFIEEPGKPIRVLYFTDTHHHPGGPLDHLKWIARHAGEGRFDVIRHGGDFNDYDSVSTHDPIGSVQAKSKPSLAADMEANEEALFTFDRELGPSTIPKIFDCGNHEKRVHKYEMLRGELEGSLWFRLQEIYAQYRWRWNDFGVITFLGGVGFTHIPLSANNGKPYSSPAIMLRDMTHDLVIGHRHKGGMYPQPKIGGDVTLYDGACSLPHGTVKEYAKLNPTGWRWGINEITIQDGKVTDFSFVSMLELQRRYA